MKGFLGRLLGRTASHERQNPPGDAKGDLNRRASAQFLNRDEGPKPAASWFEGEEGEREYQEFVERFEHAPGQNFMAFLRSQNIPELERWLHPSNSGPEAKVFVRLIVEMMRRGESLANQPALCIFSDDYVRREAANKKETKAIVDALATLAPLLHKPILLFYRGADDTMMKWEFNP